MTSDIAEHIANLSIMDTHSHMEGVAAWEGSEAPDILSDLFGWYASSDLVIAGAPLDAVERLLDPTDDDLEGRFAGIAEAWTRSRFTGYGEAVRIAARELLEIEDLSAESLRGGQRRLRALQQAGGMALLRDRARIDHVQTDLGMDVIDLPTSSWTYFLRDLSVRRFAIGAANDPMIASATGIEVRDLATLGDAIDALFVRCAPRSIAVKSQHAYVRTLAWQQRSDADAERALRVVLDGGPGSDDPDSEARRCVGDWCLGRCVALAARYDLPIKLHTGILAGTAQQGTAMPIDRLRAGHLAPLLTAYPDARFILMHIAYPFSEELIALAKHFANVTVDLCWAWALNPLATKDFVRRFLHAVPVNRLFAFGDDTNTPLMAYAYAMQARRWLTRAIEEEIADGYLTSRQAMEVASLVLRGNQEAHFDIAGRQGAIRDVTAVDAHHPWPYRSS